MVYLAPGIRAAAVLFSASAGFLGVFANIGNTSSQAPRAQAPRKFCDYLACSD